MIAVTGATGYIGRAVVAELARRGLDVVAVSRYCGCPSTASVQWRATGPAFPAAATFAGCDTVVHLAGRAHTTTAVADGRDLFDLVHAWQLGEAGSTPYAVDGAKTMQAFVWYLEQEGTHFSAQEANAHLDVRLGKAGFRRDMDTLLRPGLPAFDVDRAGEIVREAYFRHLP